MTEEVTRIIPAEISLVRVTCGGRGLTSESKVESLHKLFSRGSCPHCNVRITDSESLAAFTELQGVLQKLNSIQKKFSTQFVLGDPEAEKPN